MWVEKDNKLGKKWKKYKNKLSQPGNPSLFFFVLKNLPNIIVFVNLRDNMAEKKKKKEGRRKVDVLRFTKEEELNYKEDPPKDNFSNP